MVRILWEISACILYAASRKQSITVGEAIAYLPGTFDKDGSSDGISYLSIHSVSQQLGADPLAIDKVNYVRPAER